MILHLLCIANSSDLQSILTASKAKGSKKDPRVADALDDERPRNNLKTIVASRATEPLVVPLHPQITFHFDDGAPEVESEFKKATEKIIPEYEARSKECLSLSQHGVPRRLFWRRADVSETLVALCYSGSR
jgi:hypothetical protein